MTSICYTGYPETEVEPRKVATKLEARDDLLLDLRALSKGYHAVNSAPRYAALAPTPFVSPCKGVPLPTRCFGGKCLCFIFKYILCALFFCTFDVFKPHSLSVNPQLIPPPTHSEVCSWAESSLFTPVGCIAYIRYISSNMPYTVSVCLTPSPRPTPILSLFFVLQSLFQYLSHKMIPVTFLYVGPESLDYCYSGFSIFGEDRDIGKNGDSA